VRNDIPVLMTHIGVQILFHAVCVKLAVFWAREAEVAGLLVFGHAVDLESLHLQLLLQRPFLAQIVRLLA